MVVQMGRVPSTNLGGWAECLGEEWWRRGEQWNDLVSKSNNWESLAWQTLYIELWIIDAFALPPVVVWQCTNMFDCMTIDHKIVALQSLYKLHKDTLLSMFRRRGITWRFFLVGGLTFGGALTIQHIIDALMQYQEEHSEMQWPSVTWQHSHNDGGEQVGLF